MKKLFTLLTLLLCAVGSSWADTKPTIDGITLPDAPTATLDMTSQTDFTADENGWIVFNPKKDAVNDKEYWTNNATNGNNRTWTVPSNATAPFIGATENTTCFALQTVRVHSFRFTGAEAVSFLVKSGGTGRYAQVSLYTYDGTTFTLVETKKDKTNTVVEFLYTGLSTTTTYVAYMYGSDTNNSDLYEVAVKKPSTAPTISASPSTISLVATESGVAVSKTFTITGKYLTDGTYNLTVPTVDGLSVNPASFTVTDGTVNQEVTVSYSATENLDERTATISGAADGESFDVTVKYAANVIAWELQEVSEAKTWDWTVEPLKSTEVKLGEGDYANYSTSTEYVMANIPGISYPSSFDDKAIVFKGQFPTRNGFAQNCTLKFITTVPGSFTVTFSNTGGSNNNRWVKVTDANREQTGTIEAVGTTQNTESFKVVAGTVEITGTSALRFYKIVFTPVTEVKGNITACGFNTYSSNYPIDLSTITGGTAYVATGVRDGKVVLTKCTDKIAVGTGIMLAGEADAEFKINTYAGDATFNGTNLLVGMPNGGEVPVATEGFNYVFGWTDATNPGFYKVASDVPTLPSFKAYLHTTDALTAPSNSRLAISIDGNVSTGIDDIVSSDQQANIIFGLGGQRVAQPTKGLYIVNGKKVIIK